MSREEAIKNIKEHCYFANLIPPAKEALDMAIEALEQQPTDAVDRLTIREYLYSLGMGIKVTATDCVKRQDVEDAIYDYSRSCDVNYAQIMEFIDKLPSVTPQPKIGKWIYDKKEDSYKCSLCGYPCHKDNLGAIPTKYCANCGSKIIDN